MRLLKSRETVLLLTGAVCLSAIIVDRGLVTPWQRALRRTQGAIADRRRELAHDVLLNREANALRRAARRSAKTSGRLTESESPQSHPVALIESAAHQAGVHLDELTPQAVGNAVSVSLEATWPSLLRFLGLLEAGGSCQIQQLNIHPAQTGHLNARLQIQ